MIARLTTLDETGSTNDDLAIAARAGAPEGTAIFARQQKAGRGRLGRVWQSPPGNVFLSVLLRPALQQTPHLGQLAFVTGLAVGQAVGRFGLNWQLKWPNDVLAGGRKLAGILLESEPDWVVVGMGINVRHTPPVSDKPVTSLLQEGADATADAVVQEVLHSLTHWYGRWQSEGFLPIRSAWLEHAYNLGGGVKVALASGHMAEGRFDGLDEDGALLLEGPSGERQRIVTGDVFFT